MKLTGKCKEDFEKWYNNPLIEHVGLRRLPQWFYTLTESMQYGVYVDFFDSVGIYIQILFYDFDVSNWQICIECIEDEFDYTETHFTSRQEARIKAIEKANDIYNDN